MRSGLSLNQLWRQRELAAPILLALALVAWTAAVSTVVGLGAHDGAFRLALSRAGDAADLRASRELVPDDFRVKPDDPVEVIAAAMSAASVEFAQHTNDVALSRLHGRGRAEPLDLTMAPLLASRGDAPAHEWSAVLRAYTAEPPLLAGEQPRPVAGKWAVLLDEASARQMNLGPGGEICARVNGNEKQRFCATVSGLIANAPTPSDQGVTLLAPSATFFQIVATLPAGRARAVVVVHPDIAALAADDSSWLEKEIRGARTQLGAERAPILLSTYLDNVLDAFAQDWQRAQYPLLVVAIEAFVLTGLAAAAVAHGAFRQQRDALALWRMRGWTRGQLLGRSLGQLLALAVIALPIGVLTGNASAPLVLQQAGLNGQAGRDALVASVVASIAALTLVVLAMLALSWSETRWSRPGIAVEGDAPRAGWSRLGAGLGVLGMVLLAVAWSLMVSSVPSTSATLDALVFAAVGAGLIANAVVLALPYIAASLHRFSLPLTLEMVRARLAAGRAEHRQVATVFTLAISLATFAFAFAATNEHAADDRAGYRVGADSRIVLGNTRPPVAASVGGTSALVFRGYAHVASLRDDVEVLGVGSDLVGAAWWRNDLASQSLGALVDSLAREEHAEILINDGQLQIWLHADGGTAHAQAELTDARGRSCSADLGSVAPGSWVRLSAPIICAQPGSLPLRMRRLEFVSAVIGGPTSDPRRVSISDLATVDSSGQVKLIEAFASSNASVPGRPSFSGVAGAPLYGNPYGPPSAWWYEDPDTGDVQDLVRADLRVPRDDQPTVTFDVGPDAGRLTVLPPPSLATIPAVASPGLLAALGLDETQTVFVTIGRAAFPVTLLSTAGHFPTLYPELGEFLILPRDALVPVLARFAEPHPWPNELWISGAGTSAARAAALSTNEVSAVLDRADVAEQIRSEPIARAVFSLLLVGLIATLVLSTLALILHFALVGGARRPTHAILEALGAGPTQLTLAWVGEQAAVALFAMAAGVLVGVAAAAAVVPGLRLGVTLQDSIPSAQLQVNALQLTVALIAIALVVTSMRAVLAGTHRPRSLASELRDL